MLDLGKYADAILWSWGLTLLLLVGLTLMSLRASRKAKADLMAAEERRKNG
ncbi:heme exporter protein CcmD [Aliiroseovarius lamellibrachiae]|uniref:heme exporter protein CcmD n=1 Tax=Aliiroseovarius lamellibrachiae TaxID=1924933 RepID=UPI001BDFE0F5|nr:heme exporter protein CcmD [Aliiroseovarius lamellibrachiae]MBT2130710.1 heme exporter protein CcmD [Aliiroseovarius lamellibrachiae]